MVYDNYLKRIYFIILYVFLSILLFFWGLSSSTFLFAVGRCFYRGPSSIYLSSMACTWNSRKEICTCTCCWFRCCVWSVLWKLKDVFNLVYSIFFIYFLLHQYVMNTISKIHMCTILLSSCVSSISISSWKLMYIFIYFMKYFMNDVSLLVV